MFQRLWAWLRGPRGDKRLAAGRQSSDSNALDERGPAESLGERGEEAAARYLRRQGFTILARHHRSRWGELDLVAVEGRVVVFVEVKTRRSDATARPAEAVNADKQRRLTRLALAYLKRHRLLECPARFDVVAVTWPRDDQPPLIEHVRGAFEATGRDGFFS